ncbi:MAG: polysaccharide biosynthesis protein [Lachnospiraceae bacterium]|nr:polysaccharide biosynthesis protein [Lachnospiraceae bacterium]
MGKKEKKDGFILQAGILAAAGIICRLIGLLYRSPLTAVIGDRGMGYFQSAYNIYTIILLISSYSIPAAISKVIAQKLSLREYRNAHRIFVCAMWYAMVVGGAAGLVLFFGAGILLDGPAVTVLRVFAPTIFLYGILGVLRGYFQAHRSMAQTSVSQILEQILNAAVSIGAALFLIMSVLGDADYYVISADGAVSFGGEVIEEQADVLVDENGLPVSDETGATVYILTAEQEEWNTKHATYGAIGSAIGTGAGVLTALLFMWAVYGMNRQIIQRRMQRDRTEQVDSYGTILRMITSVVMPFILSTAIYNVNTSLNQTIYTKLYMFLKDMSEKDAFTNYGIFAGKAVVIRNIPVALSSAMSAAILPTISTAWARQDQEDAIGKVYKAVKVTMMVCIPAAVGIGVLAKPVMQLLFPQKESLELASMLLRTIAISVVFYALSTLTNSVLQGIGKVNVPVKNAALALIPQTLVLVLLILFTDLGLYALVFTDLIYSGLMCVLNQRALRRFMGYRQELLRSFIVPAVASAVMGLVAWGVYQGVYYLASSNVIALVCAVIAGAVAYFVLEIVLRGVTETELRSIPKGYLLVKIAKKCRIM